jgi:hypothetical protein
VSPSGKGCYRQLRITSGLPVNQARRSRRNGRSIISIGYESNHSFLQAIVAKGWTVQCCPEVASGLAPEPMSEVRSDSRNTRISRQFNYDCELT